MMICHHPAEHLMFRMRSRCGAQVDTGLRYCPPSQQILLYNILLCVIPFDVDEEQKRVPVKADYETVRATLRLRNLFGFDLYSLCMLCVTLISFSMRTYERSCCFMAFRSSA